jgi:ribose-phosphate pyrophosphokinase
VANIITAAGATRALAIDLHAAQLQGFFDIPMDHLYAAPVLVEYFRQLNIKDLTIVSPDVGGIKMARAYAKRLNADLAIVDKRPQRPDRDRGHAHHRRRRGPQRHPRRRHDLDGDVDHGGAKHCRKKGAKDIYICGTHAVLAGKAVEKLQKAPVKEVVVTDTIPTAGKEFSNLKVLSIANLLGEAIRRIHHSESVSTLFQ